MRFLIFRLYAQLASWGEVAVGEVRPSASHPSQSALLGLLGAALGLERDDEGAHMALRDGYGFVIGVIEPGRLLRDYHTAQVPGRASLKKYPHRTRRDELSLPKDDLNTILSTRDYRQDAVSLVALWKKPGAPHPLPALQAALAQPKFTLYLGRKACPPALPLCPRVLEATNARAALELVEFPPETGLTHDKNGTRLPLQQLIWSDDAVMDVSPTLSVPRKDRLLSRRRWQFGDRMEHVALAPVTVASDEENPA